MSCDGEPSRASALTKLVPAPGDRGSVAKSLSVFILTSSNRNRAMGFNCQAGSCRESGWERVANVAGVWSEARFVVSQRKSSLLGHGRRVDRGYRLAGLLESPKQPLSHR